MVKPNIYITQGLAMKLLTDLKGPPHFSEEDGCMKAARIAFPTQSNEQEVIAEFVDLSTQAN